MILYNGTPLEINYNKDKTLKLNVNPYIVSSKHIIIWYFENNEEMLSLYYLTTHVKSKSRNPIHLIMPYIPGSIVDIPENNSNVYTLKYFCNFINSLGFEKVRVLDPYSYISIALLNNVEVYDIKPYLNAACDKTRSNSLDLFFYHKEDADRYAKLLPSTKFKTHKQKDVLIISNYLDSAEKELQDLIDSLNKEYDKIYVYATYYKLNPEIEENRAHKIDKIFTTKSLINPEYKNLEIIERMI